MDDVPIGGRVTRSLRKRLTSVDSSDLVTRPSTPQLTKLSTIAESGSPSRPIRATRRNSTTANCTPVKTLKKSATSTISESPKAENSPAKRTTRRSSISTVQTPSKINQEHNVSLKTEKLNEEGKTVISKDTPVRRVTRLQSKSPSQTDAAKFQDHTSPKKILSGPKTRRIKDLNGSDTEIDVVSLEEKQSNDTNQQSEIAEKGSSISKTPSILSPENTNLNNLKHKILTIDLLEDTLEINDKGLSDEANVQQENIYSNKTKEPVKAISKTSSEDESNKLDTGKTNSSQALMIEKSENEDSHENESTIHLEFSDDDFDGNFHDADDVKGDTSPNKIEKGTTQSMFQDRQLVESVIMLQKLSPTVIAKLCNENNVLSPKNSKSVKFNKSSEDSDTIKSSYPRTPGSIKSKGYLNKGKSESDHEDKEITGKQQTELENVERNKFKEASSTIYSDAHDTGDFGEVPTEKSTPLKPKLSNILQSSTPVLDTITENQSEPVTDFEALIEDLEVKSPKTQNNENVQELSTDANIQEKIHLSTKQSDVITTSAVGANPSPQNDETTINDRKETDEYNNGNAEIDLFSKSWTHSVSGRASLDNKIDTITVKTIGNGNDVKLLSTKSKEIDKKELLANSHSTSANEPESNTTNDSFQKLEFVESEVMEAPNSYQSGDSLDEEERQEIEQNELLEDGESIGSEDTVSDDRDEYCGEEDDNASFVTSDSDKSLLEYSDDDEHVGNYSKNSKKSTNRINHVMITSESEDDVQSYNETLAKSNSNSQQQKGEGKKLNNRNCFLASSESENTEDSKIHNKEVDEDKIENISKSSKALNFNITNMIDATMDDDNMTETMRDKSDTALEDCNVQPENLEDISQNLKLNNNEYNISENKENNIARTNEEIGPVEIENGPKITNISLNKINEEECRAEGKNDEQSKITTVLTTNETISNIPKSAYQSKLSPSMGQSDKCEVQNDCDGGVHSNRDPICSQSKPTDMNTNEVNIKKSLSAKNVPIISTDSVIAINEEYSKIEVMQMKGDAPQTDNENSYEENVQNPFDSGIGYISSGISDRGKLSGIVNEKLTEPECPETESDDAEDIEILDTNDEVDEESSNKEFVEVFDCTLKEKTTRKKIGLSSSFCQANKSNAKKSVLYNSFTIGVNVMKRDNLNQMESSVTFSDSDVDDSCESNAENAVKGNEVELDKEEEEELEKLKHSNLKIANVKCNRHSMISSDAHAIEAKRQSLQLFSKEKFNPSKSLIESIEDRKRDLDANKRSRLSKSYNGSIKNRETSDPKASDSCTSSDSKEETENKEINISSTLRNSNKNKKDISSILDRCDQILEAANRAKLESKQNSKKSKIMLPKLKKGEKPEFSSDEESANHAPIAVKECKHSREKTTSALERAFRASANILMNEAGKNKMENFSLQKKDKEQYDDKRLPMAILESLSDPDSTTKSKKLKCNKRTRSPLVQRLNCQTGEIIEEAVSPKKKKRVDILNKFELPTGTVLEEPLTPKKKMNFGGFRESPITPRNIGFKVRHILTAGQDTVPELPLNVAEQKRKRKIADPEHTLPKPQWSQSGFFLEELLPNFNDKKKLKFRGSNSCGSGIEGSSAVSALNFKNSTIFRKNVPRESSQELLKRKERQHVSRKYI